MVICLAFQVIDMNAFPFFVDVGDRCAGLSLEAAACMNAVVCSATRLDECVSGRGCECSGIKIGIDFTQVASIWCAIHDESFGMRWRELESHLGELLACFGEAGGFRRGGGGCGGGGGGIVHFDELLHDAWLVQKGCSRFGSGGVVKCCECGVIWEGCLIAFVYLIVIAHKICEVVAAAIAGKTGLVKCAKSGICVNVIVLTAACRRTTNTFRCGECTLGDALLA